MTDRSSPVSETPVVKSFAGSTKDDRCLEVWFASEVTDATRTWLLEAINEKALRSAIQSTPASLETVERLVDDLLQTSIDYERAEGFEAKYRRQDLEEAKQAVRNALTAGLAQCQQQWQPIETAPKDGSWIITLSHPWSDIPVSLHWDGSRWWDDAPEQPSATAFSEWQPTHWLPRSALPSVSSTDREGK